MINIDDPPFLLNSTEIMDHSDEHSALQSGEESPDSNIVSNEERDEAYSNDTLGESSLFTNKVLGDMLKDPDFPKYEFSFDNQYFVKEDKYPFHCDVCPGKYSRCFSLKRHYIRKHINYVYLNQNDITNCSITKSAFNTYKIKYKNILNQDGRNVFEIMNAFKQQKDIYYQFCCNNCLEFFDNKDLLKEHTVNCHNETPDNQKRSSNYIYYCSYCSEFFVDLQSLKKHKESHKVSCNICMSKFTQKKDLELHIIKKHKNSPHCCFECHQDFDEQSELQEHLKQHNIKDDRNQLQSEKTLASHGINTELKKPKQFKCTECPKSFVSNGNLRRHGRQVHTVHKPFLRKRNRNNTLTDEIDAKFFNSLSANIADNLLNHIDGKACDIVQSPKSVDNYEEREDFPWEFYNFPVDFEKSNISKNKEYELYISNLPEIFINESSQKCVLKKNSDDILKKIKDLSEIPEIIGMLYKCKLCKTSYFSLEEIYNHHINNHDTIENQKENDNIPSDVYQIIVSPIGPFFKKIKYPFKSQDNRQMTCTKCRATFNTTADLHKHIIECGSNVLNDKYKANNSLSNSESITKMPEKLNHLNLDFETNLIHSCDSCHRTFNHSVSLERHKKSCFLRNEFLSKYYKDKKKNIRKINNFCNKTVPSAFILKMKKHLKLNLINMKRKQKKKNSKLGHNLISVSKKVSSSNIDLSINIENKENIKKNAATKHDSSQHWCSFCRRSFAYLANYRKHISDGCPIKKQMEENQNSNESNEKENIDKEAKLSKRGQIEQTMLGLLSNQSRQSEIIGTSEKASSKFKTFSCVICHKIFFCLVKLIQHTILHKLKSDDSPSPSDSLEQCKTSDESLPQNKLCENLKIEEISNAVECGQSKESVSATEETVSSVHITESENKETSNSSSQNLIVSSLQQETIEFCSLPDISDINSNLINNSSNAEISQIKNDKVPSLSHLRPSHLVNKKETKTKNSPLQPGPSGSRKRKVDPTPKYSRPVRVSRNKNKVIESENTSKKDKKERKTKTATKRAKRHELVKAPETPKKRIYKSRSERQRKIITPKKYK